MALNFDIFLLVGSILLFISLIAGKTGYRFGVPTLLLFLIIGIVFGSGGLGLQFSSPSVAQNIGIVALNIILFSGGMDTRLTELKPIAVQGVLLATVGVLLTALITGLFVFWVTNNILQSVTFSLFESLLLAGIMSSTDSASVFAILRSKKLSLQQNLRPLLELESGSNDPMAFMITIMMIQLLTLPEISGWFVLVKFLQQLLFGAALGYILGMLSVRLINNINLDNDALYSVLMVTIMFFLFGFTTFVGGNGYLAVYVGGLMIGNHRVVHRRSMMRFFDGLTWLFQIIMFLALGLLVNPDELLPVLGVAAIIGLFLTVVARPFAVFTTLLPSKRLSFKAKLFTSWVGLRGAVPIIFATYPLINEVTQAKIMFNIVFVITIISLLLQGTTVPVMAKWLGLTQKAPQKRKLKEFDVEFSDEIKSAMCEIKVNKNMLNQGNRLLNIDLPEHTLVVMVKRDQRYFIPRGNTQLEEGDSLLVITDNEEAMHETYRQLGINPLE
ncbi:MAG: potassium/proton antiporter [Paludibacter sp.]|nr:potassium/proton antiporter [Paludibacter sp.]